MSPRLEGMMTVIRSHAGHQTRYELYEESLLTCVVTYSAEPGEAASWKLLLPGADGAENLYHAHRFADPDAVQLQSWLTPVIGSDSATELANAIDSSPPAPAGWKRRTSSG
jgi:hypothetical protein